MADVCVNIKSKGLDVQVNVPYGTTLSTLRKQFEDKLKMPVLLARVENDLKELMFPLRKDCTVTFLDLTDANGFRTYQRSAFFLLICAIREVLGKTTRVVINRSVNKNYYCELPNQSDSDKLTSETVAKIEQVMRRFVSEDLPIEKISLGLEDALIISEEFGMPDKIDVLKYRRTSKVNFYKLSSYYDYFYGQMVESTGALKEFKLHLDEKEIVLQFPNPENPGTLLDVVELKKMKPVFVESKKWAEIVGVDTVGALNNKICSGEFFDIVRTSEALHEKKVAEIADEIYRNGKNVVLIAGPSSSGKTTFANRLSIQLKVNGLKPYVISMDNYFREARLAPVDAEGNPDFENVSHVDVDKLNDDLFKLTNGERVPIPTYNFQEGKAEYRGDYICLEKNGVLIIEGIHGLNPIVASTISPEQKFRIFISALTQLNVDDHNRIPTTDTRLLRRIVRDSQFRGYSAEKSITAWPKVVHGERVNIFPFQEEADAVFNSALVYELCILKQYAEPLLFGVKSDLPQYVEARRLVKFLDSFLGVSSEQIQINSILREFIGGSCFKT